MRSDLNEEVSQAVLGSPAIYRRDEEIIRLTGAPAPGWVGNRG